MKFYGFAKSLISSSMYRKNERALGSKVMGWLKIYVWLFSEGKRHDCGLLSDSHLLHDLEKFAFAPHGHAMCIYGDPTYPIRIHLKAPYKDPQLTPEKDAYNRSMSEVKTPTELIFPEVFNSFKFLDYQNNHKISLDCVSKMHVVCCLVQNALTCYYGNETATFFSVPPPTIFDYFS